ncbi:AbrB family transcriptional regulator [Janthinobacterium sp. GMG1]|uniref:AbrB family transcriptional regulator n=1 Tax=Janthinobacterium sp. GMG1 TaxID=3096007 RepID=UPI002ACAFB0C|nr:AbrB family transcriptional regulator [Janthinobacterium sp. GMG1]MDZ5635928.1 AbrB family transcriptional regulator [Janthinobacterium sp. GMG1]
MTRWPRWRTVYCPSCAALVTGLAGHHLLRRPELMMRTDPLFVVIALGTCFGPAFLDTAPRYMAGAARCSFLMLLVAAFGLGLSHWLGIHPCTAILTFSPGGIAKMSLTAKTLHMGAPIVTALHVFSC